MEARRPRRVHTLEHRARERLVHTRGGVLRAAMTRRVARRTAAGRAGETRTPDGQVFPPTRRVRGDVRWDEETVACSHLRALKHLN